MNYKTTKQLKLGVGIIDSLNLAGIFALFIKEFLHQFLESTAKYLMFPLALVASLITIILAWREAALTKKKSAFIHAGVETLAGLAIGTAVLGSFVAATLFSLAVPIIFAATLGAKSLYHLGLTGFYLYQGFTSTNPVAKAHNYQLAAANAVGTFVGLLLTAGVIGVMFLGKPILAILGIIGGTLSASYLAYQAYKMAKQPGPVVLPSDDHAAVVAEQEPLLGPQPAPLAPAKRVQVADAATQTEPDVIREVSNVTVSSNKASLFAVKPQEAVTNPLRNYHRVYANF